MSKTAQKTFPRVTMITLDFARLQHRSDQQIYAEFENIRLSSRKPIFPKNVRYNTWRVTRQPNRITIHLAIDGQDVAYYSFAPAPSYL